MHNGEDASWFELLFGVPEKPAQFHEHFRGSTRPDGFHAITGPDGRVFRAGRFDTPTVRELRMRAASARAQASQSCQPAPPKIVHLATGDVLPMHARNPNCVFQAASQFNCLEFPSPHCTPESGVTDYEGDPTQGPACALACATGTIWRNYFHQMPRPDGTVQRGQSADCQINCLDALETAIDNARNKYWTIKNGYTQSSAESLSRFSAVVTETSRDQLLSLIKIGLHSDVPVVFDARQPDWHLAETPVDVHQVYCSATSIGYTYGIDAAAFEPLARLVLDAAYEATLLSAQALGAKKVFLTKIGGGVFRNPGKWIAESIARACTVAGEGLEIVICHYGRVDQTFVDDFTAAYGKNL